MDGGARSKPQRTDGRGILRIMRAVSAGWNAGGCREHPH